MPRGGARPGAGRPRKNPEAPVKAKKPAAKKAAGRSLSKLKEQGVPEAASWPFGTKPPEPEKPAEDPKGDLPACGPEDTPLSFLLMVMRDPGASVSARLQAAIQAAPYVHPKVAPQGKKDASKAAAKAVGKFSASPPPLALVKR